MATSIFGDQPTGDWQFSVAAVLGRGRVGQTAIRHMLDGAQCPACQKDLFSPSTIEDQQLRMLRDGRRLIIVHNDCESPGTLQRKPTPQTLLDTVSGQRPKPALAATTG